MGKIFTYTIAMIIIAILALVICEFLDSAFGVSITGYPNLDGVIVISLVALTLILVRNGIKPTLSAIRELANFGKISKELWLGILNIIGILGVILAIIMITMWLFHR